MLNLFPNPRRLTLGSEHANLALRSRVWTQTQLSPRLHQCIHDCLGTGPVPIQISSVEPDEGELLLRINIPRKGFQSQQYSLNVTRQGIDLSAGSEAGVYYGLQSLAQLIRGYGSRLPVCKIEDYPDFQQRAYMLDVSRCKVPSMETLYRLIDQLATLRINQLQLYIEHTFAFSGHPLVWQDASPFTPGEIQALDTYCKNRYISLVPNLNSFGHFERWLRYPEYHRYAECPKGFQHPLGGFRAYGSTLKPNRNSLQLLSELYAEYLPNFSGSDFNIGADEPWELGQGWSKKRCLREGKQQVYLDFLQKINRLVKQHGRRMMFWGDIVLEDPGALNQVPEDSTALIWGYEGDHPFSVQCRQMANLGLPFYVCPGTSSWNSLTGRSANAMNNLKNAAKQGLKWGAEGYLITDWGDHGHHQYLPISYSGLLLGACYSWCLKSNQNIEPEAGLNQLFFRDTTGNTGQLYWELGRVLELAPSPLRNASIFNQLLFWPMDHQPGYMAGISDNDLQRCLHAFDELEERLMDCRSAAIDGSLVAAEFRNTLAMARHGIQRYLLYTGSVSDTSRVRKQLQAIIPAHEQLWLARNRLGGLYESSSHLRRSLQPLLAR